MKLLPILLYVAKMVYMAYRLWLTITCFIPWCKLSSTVGGSRQGHREMGTVDIKEIPRHGGVCAEAVDHNQSWREWKQSHHMLVVSASCGFGHAEQKDAGIASCPFADQWAHGNTQNWEDYGMKRYVQGTSARRAMRP